MECMINSDNVVRGGLTPKLKDTETLCEILPYDSFGPATILEGATVLQSSAFHLQEFAPPGYDELRVFKLETKREAPVMLPKFEFMAIMIVMEGDADVQMFHKSYHASKFSSWYVAP
jgi:mannose-6-phosphate isomerase